MKPAIMLLAFFWITGIGVAQSQHQAGKVCSSCHQNFRIGGTVFSDSTGTRGQAGVSLSLLDEAGNEIALGLTDSSGNIVSTTAPDGRYLVRLGNVASRTWHAIPQQGMCNSCHFVGGNLSEARSRRLPQMHTRIPADNNCLHCHFFPASQAYQRLATTGVLSNSSTPPPIPASQVEIQGKAYRFDPATARIATVRPDVFAAGYFSMFDVILEVSRSNNIPVEHAFDAARQTHFISKINGIPGDYWYHFSYDAGSGNSAEIQYRRANRWDELLWRPGVWIKVVSGEELESIRREYLEEIEREKQYGHIIPSVRITINASQYRGNPPGSGRISGVNREYRNVGVTAHNTRAAGSRSTHPKPFQPGVVTAIDVLYSLQDQGLIDQLSSVYYSYFAQNYIESQYVVAMQIPGIGLAHSSGRQGFVYVTENGAPGNLPNQADGKLHVTSDVLVIHAPDFTTWQWAELGNPYYEAAEPLDGQTGSTLYLPRAISSASEQTGLALTNASSLPANVTIRGYDSTGVLASVLPPATNPALIILPARNQVARLLNQLFPSGFTQPGGWLEIAGDQPGTSGFFLNFDPQLSTMDGAGIGGGLLTRMVFPEIQDAEITLVNPSATQIAQTTLRLMDNLGQEVAASASRPIAARRSLTFRAKELFANVPENGNGYLFVNSSLGLAPLEIFGKAGVHASVLNALDGGTNYRELYAPQFVQGGGFKSTLLLINLEGRTTAISLSWRDDSGQRIGQSATVNLPARGRLSLSDPGMFGVTVPAAGLQGYLAVSSSAANITGAVKFGDPGESSFQTALPLLSVGRTEALFSQVAQDETYFTGVAVLNPNSEAAQVTIAVFDSRGAQMGNTERTLPAKNRFSKLLPEIVTGLPFMSSGYFRLNSSLPLIHFAVFGTSTLSALSAIP